MVPAEFADRVDDFVHLPQGHPIHLLVQLIEICFYLLIIIGAVFVVAFIEHSQHGISIAVVEWMLLDMGFQCSEECVHNITVLIRFG